MPGERGVPADQLFTGTEETEDKEHDYDPIISPENRPRGILSPTDREYLCGLKEYDQPQTDANRRQDIRKRVVNGFNDFVLLSLFLEPREREKVFEELGPEETDDVIASMVAMAYLGVEGDRPRLERCIEHGVLQGASIGAFDSTGRATDAEVSISVEYDPDIEELHRRFEDGKELTDAEIGALVRAGKLDGNDLDEFAEPPGTFPSVFMGGSLNTEE